MINDFDMEELTARVCQLGLDLGGYRYTQVEGQRVFGPPCWWYWDPPQDTEVYVTGLPVDMYEDELVVIMKAAGSLYQMRILMEFSGNTRGTAYVKYTNPMEAKLAQQFLTNMRLRDGCVMKVHKSYDNRFLFIGKIPIDFPRKVLRDAFDTITGYKSVNINIQRYSKGAGRYDFAIVEYKDHSDAILARKAFQYLDIRINSQRLDVDWAEANPLVLNNANSNNISIYFRNLSPNITHRILEIKINRLIYPHRVVSVKKRENYAIVKFPNNEIAEYVFNQLKDQELDGREIEIMWSQLNRGYRIRRKYRNYSKPSESDIILYANRETEPEPLIVTCPKNNYYTFSLPKSRRYSGKQDLVKWGN